MERKCNRNASYRNAAGALRSDTRARARACIIIIITIANHLKRYLLFFSSLSLCLSLFFFSLITDTGRAVHLRNIFEFRPSWIESRRVSQEDAMVIMMRIGFSRFTICRSPTRISEKHESLALPAGREERERQRRPCTWNTCHNRVPSLLREPCQPFRREGYGIRRLPR